MHNTNTQKHIDEQTDDKSILLNLCITQWFMDNDTLEKYPLYFL